MTPLKFFVTILIICALQQRGESCAATNYRKKVSLWDQKQELRGLKPYLEETLIPDPATYNGFRGGPVDFADQLNCDFERSETCCWKNYGEPVDKFDWIVGRGIRSPAGFRTYFGPNPPSSRFLLSFGGPAAPSHNAMFASCYIPCSDTITLSLRHWSSKLVKLEVCQQRISDLDDEVINCRSVNPASSPGPSILRFPPMKNYRLVIRSSNYAHLGGAVIDDIRVNYEDSGCDWESEEIPTRPTQKTKTSRNRGKIFQKKVPSIRRVVVGRKIDYTTPKPTRNTHAANTSVDIGDVATGGACSAAECTFRQGTCHYVKGPDISELEAKFPFFFRSGKFRNRLTGVRRGAPLEGRSGSTDENSGYVAAYLLPGEATAIQSAVFNLPVDHFIDISYYLATVDTSLSVCFDTLDYCPFKTPAEIESEDRMWRQSVIRIPAGTRKVMFLARNFGRNQGAVGIDSITLYKIDGFQKACIRRS